MPTKRLSTPMLARERSCCSMPSRWSLNHQAEPNWIFPAVEASWKQPAQAASLSLSAALRV